MTDKYEVFDYVPIVYEDGVLVIPEFSEAEVYKIAVILRESWKDGLGKDAAMSVEIGLRLAATCMDLMGATVKVEKP